MAPFASPASAQSPILLRIYLDYLRHLPACNGFTLPSSLKSAYPSAWLQIGYPYQTMRVRVLTSLQTGREGNFCVFFCILFSGPRRQGIWEGLGDSSWCRRATMEMSDLPLCTFKARGSLKQDLKNLRGGLFFPVPTGAGWVDASLVFCLLFFVI
ncbi:hypothetical protein FPV67DRAFT_631478 [Lyophyllum atratum]|nr:hypothetical protein FPV67DRAFT_631478 [Lyophyllum atratum]